MIKHQDSVTVIYGKSAERPRTFIFSVKGLDKIIKEYQKIETSKRIKRSIGAKQNKKRITCIRETSEKLYYGRIKVYGGESLDELCKEIGVTKETMRTYLHQIDYDYKRVK